MLQSFDFYNKNNSNLLLTSGVITWKRAHWLTTYATHMILDAESWLSSVAAYLRDEAMEAVDFYRPSDADAADGLADELDDWLNGDNNALSTLSYIAIRQALHPRLVTRDDYERHVGRLQALAQEPVVEEPKYLWTPDSRKPTLFVADSHAYLAAHTGPDTVGLVIEQAELNQRCGALIKSLP